MHELSKTNLSFDEYEKYGIDQSYMAYRFTYDKVTIEDANTIELKLIENEYKVFSVETIAQHSDLYQLVIVAAKSKGFTF